MVLQTVDNNGGEDSLPRSKGTSKGENVIVALEEVGQVWVHPETGHLLAFVGKVGGVLGEVAEDAVLGRQPGSDGLNNGH